jgi:RNA polymerase sigma-B factor
MLEQDLGRAPTNDEVADLLGLDSEAVHEVLVATHARTVHSIDAEDGVVRQLGDPVDAFERSTDRSVLHQAIQAMPADRRYVLVRYFEDGCTQTQIGDEIGRSQMYVSRLIKQSVKELRQVMV